MKKLLPLSFFGALILGAFAVPAGCGDPCVSACEDAKSCDGAPQDTDCQAQCDQAKADAEAAGCGSQYDDQLSSCSGEFSCDGTDELSASCEQATAALIECAFANAQ